MYLLKFRTGCMNETIGDGCSGSRARIQDEMKSAGVDIGEGEAAPAEQLTGEGAPAAETTDDARAKVLVRKSRARTRGPRKPAEQPVPDEANA